MSLLTTGQLLPFLRAAVIIPWRRKVTRSVNYQRVFKICRYSAVCSALWNRAWYDTKLQQQNYFCVLWEVFHMGVFQETLHVLTKPPTVMQCWVSAMCSRIYHLWGAYAHKLVGSVKDQLKCDFAERVLTAVEAFIFRLLI